MPTLSEMYDTKPEIAMNILHATIKSRIDKIVPADWRRLPTIDLFLTLPTEALIQIAFSEDQLQATISVAAGFIDNHVAELDREELSDSALLINEAAFKLFSNSAQCKKAQRGTEKSFYTLWQELQPEDRNDYRDKLRRQRAEDELRRLRAKEVLNKAERKRRKRQLQECERKYDQVAADVKIECEQLQESSDRVAQQAKAALERDTDPSSKLQADSDRELLAQQKRMLSEYEKSMAYFTQHGLSSGAYGSKMSDIALSTVRGPDAPLPTVKPLRAADSAICNASSVVRPEFARATKNQKQSERRGMNSLLREADAAVCSAQAKTNEGVESLFDYKHPAVFLQLKDSSGKIYRKQDFAGKEHTHLYQQLQAIALVQKGSPPEAAIRASNTIAAALDRVAEVEFYKKHAATKMPFQLCGYVKVCPDFQHGNCSGSQSGKCPQGLAHRCGHCAGLHMGGAYWETGGFIPLKMSVTGYHKLSVHKQAGCPKRAAATISGEPVPNLFRGAKFYETVAATAYPACFTMEGKNIMTSIAASGDQKDLMFDDSPLMPPLLDHVKYGNMKAVRVTDILELRSEKQLKNISRKVLKKLNTEGKPDELESYWEHFAPHKSTPFSSFAFVRLTLIRESDPLASHEYVRTTLNKEWDSLPETQKLYWTEVSADQCKRVARRVLQPDPPFCGTTAVPPVRDMLRANLKRKAKERAGQSPAMEVFKSPARPHNKRRVEVRTAAPTREQQSQLEHELTRASTPATTQQSEPAHAPTSQAQKRSRTLARLDKAASPNQTEAGSPAGAQVKKKSHLRAADVPPLAAVQATPTRGEQEQRQGVKAAHSVFRLLNPDKLKLRKTANSASPAAAAVVKQEASSKLSPEASDAVDKDLLACYGTGPTNHDDSGPPPYSLSPYHATLWAAKVAAVKMLETQAHFIVRPTGFPSTRENCLSVFDVLDKHHTSGAGPQMSAKFFVDVWNTTADHYGNLCPAHFKLIALHMQHVLRIPREYMMQSKILQYLLTNEHTPESLRNTSLIPEEPVSILQFQGAMLTLTGCFERLQALAQQEDPPNYDFQNKSIWLACDPFSPMQPDVETPLPSYCSFFRGPQENLGFLSLEHLQTQTLPAATRASVSKRRQSKARPASAQRYTLSDTCKSACKTTTTGLRRLHHQRPPQCTTEKAS